MFFNGAKKKLSLKKRMELKRKKKKISFLNLYKNVTKKKTPSPAKKPKPTSPSKIGTDEPAKSLLTGSRLIPNTGSHLLNIFTPEQVHQNFLKGNFNLQNYEMFLSHSIENQIDLKFREIKSQTEPEKFNFNEWADNLRITNNEILGTNGLKHYLQNKQNSQEMLDKAIDYLYFEQIDEIIETYKKSELQNIEESPQFANQQDREEMKKRVNKYISQIHKYLNKILDEPENQEYQYNEYYHQQFRFTRHIKRKNKNNKKSLLVLSNY